MITDSFTEAAHIEAVPISFEEIAAQGEMLDERKPGEIALGNAPFYARPLYVLMLRYRRAAELQAIELRYTTAAVQKAELHAQICENAGKSEFLRVSFWTETKYALGRWTDSIGIRRDWEVVIVAPAPSNPVTEMFKEFFGGPQT